MGNAGTASGTSIAGTMYGCCALTYQLATVAGKLWMVLLRRPVKVSMGGILLILRVYYTISCNLGYNMFKMFSYNTHHL